MAKFSDMLVYLRKRQQLSQSDLACRTGIGRSAISMYETGRREPDFETLEIIADYFNVDMDFLMGKSSSERKVSLSSPLPNNILPMPKMRKVPLLGVIACGEPILAAENIEEMVSMPENVEADFALRCKGDSMINARIFDGDLVYIRQQPSVENGEIAAVLIDDEATLKRVRLSADRIILMPENAAFDPLVYIGEEMNTVRILGKAVAFTSIVR